MLQRALGLVPFFALPSPAILVVRIAGLYAFQTRGTYEYPLTGFIDSDAIQHISNLVASITSLFPNSFDRHLSRSLYRRPDRPSKGYSPWSRTTEQGGLQTSGIRGRRYRLWAIQWKPKPHSPHIRGNHACIRPCTQVGFLSYVYASKPFS